MKTFNECCVMVRQPVLEVMSQLKRADYRQPALRYLLCILASHQPPAPFYPPNDPHPHIYECSFLKAPTYRTRIFDGI